MKKWQYRAIHTAISAVYGKPTRCELCDGQKESKRIEWSNKDHKYTLERQDWWQLCSTCHRNHDRNKFGHKTWNKGRKGLQRNHNFEGLVAGGWNKGVSKYTDISCAVCSKLFRPAKKTNKFCSKGCATKSRYMIENNLLALTGKE